MAQKRVNFPLVPVVSACVYGIVLPLQPTVVVQFIDTYQVMATHCLD